MYTQNTPNPPARAFKGNAHRVDLHKARKTALKSPSNVALLYLGPGWWGIYTWSMLLRPLRINTFYLCESGKLGPIARDRDKSEDDSNCVGDDLNGKHTNTHTHTGRGIFKETCKHHIHLHKKGHTGIKCTEWLDIIWLELFIRSWMPYIKTWPYLSISMASILR